MFAAPALSIIISGLYLIATNIIPLKELTNRQNTIDKRTNEQKIFFSTQNQIAAEISIGELLDKITILEIKSERIKDDLKHRNIMTELEVLQNVFTHHVIRTDKLDELYAALKDANLALWEIEDLIRDKEREKQFDNEFIKLARSVYFCNDERCRIKRTINEYCGSHLIEEKSYTPYT